MPLCEKITKFDKWKDFFSFEVKNLDIPEQMTGSSIVKIESVYGG
jgi:hypothetical protein